MVLLVVEAFVSNAYVSNSTLGTSATKQFRFTGAVLFLG